MSSAACRRALLLLRLELRAWSSARRSSCSQLQSSMRWAAQAFSRSSRAASRAWAVSRVPSAIRPARRALSALLRRARPTSAPRVPTGWPERAASPMRWRSSRQAAASRGEKGRSSGICHGPSGAGAATVTARRPDAVSPPAAGRENSSGRPGHRRKTGQDPSAGKSGASPGRGPRRAGTRIQSADMYHPWLSWSF